MKKNTLILLFILIFGWLSIASYSGYEVAIQVLKLNVVDSIKVGERFSGSSYPPITDIVVSASNADTLTIVIRNPTTAANDTAEVVLH